MTVLHVGANTYEIIRGSDVDRDGMFLEARLLESGHLVDIAEVFYSDQTGQYTVTCYVQDVPMELIEYLVGAAKRSLPPMADVSTNHA